MSKIICRVCLLKCPSSSITHPLADQQTRKMLFECTSVLVTPGDKYPQQLCIKCWIKCKSCSAFQTLARDSDRQLRLKEQNGAEGENNIMFEKEEVIVKQEAMLEDENNKKYTEDPLRGYSWAPESEGEEISIPSVCDSEIKQNRATEGLSAIKANKCGLGRTSLKSKTLVPHVRADKTNIECSKTFRNEHQLRLHQLAHNAIKTTETSSANHKLPAVQNIESELTPFKWTTETRDGHSVKVSKCGYCAKTFPNLASLIAHARVHTNVNYFPCDSCNKWFGNKSLLKTHQMTHINKSKLLKHHNTATPFKCDECEKAFCSINSLRKHKKLHKNLTM